MSTVLTRDGHVGRSEEVRQKAWADFQTDTKDHVLVELVEGAGFRRLVVGKPGSGFYHYTLTTWPGYLAVTGDMGAWVFTRLPDMFDFFRGKPGQINPTYWAEKLVAVDTTSSVRRFDLDTLRDFIRDYYEDDPKQQSTYLRALEGTDEDDERAAIEALTEAGMEDAYKCHRTEFTHGFLWICHAIVLAIAKYDAQNAESPRCDHYTSRAQVESA